jgi:hypothetical protein
MERFWSKVDKTDLCWNWTAGLDAYGYGQFRYEGKTMKAHRLAWLFVNNNIDDNLSIDHICRNRKCVNPSHMELVTRGENVRRGKGADHWRNKTHCPSGHKYDDENTAIYSGRRNCKTCRREKYHEMKKLKRRV